MASLTVGIPSGLSAARNYREQFAERTNQVDKIVIAAVEDAFDLTSSGPVAVAAVGGYGRSELFPFSDIDLLFLFGDDEALRAAAEPVSQCLRSLWDSGLRVSQSVRTVNECCRLNEQNVELHISTLDRRYLVGSDDLFKRFDTGVATLLSKQGTALLARVGELATNRHTKFNDTVYHLEPNVKEAPGGVRDVHLIEWAARLSPNHDALREMQAALQPARDFLHSVRCALHFKAGRDNNLLSFESQDDLAQYLPIEPMDPASWMREYYANARQVFQAARRCLEVSEQSPAMLRHFRDWRARLSTAEFTVSRDRVFLRHPAEVTGSADSLLRLFTFVARHGIALSWDAHRRLHRDRAPLGHMLREDGTWADWKELLGQPHAALAMREMQQCDLLAGAIPEWSKIDSLVVRDFYHRYTVDEHSLVAIEIIDELASDSENQPARLKHLLSEETNPALLRLALLLHDVGKGATPGNHVDGSMAVATIVMGRLGVPQEDRQAVLFLIERHLDLSLVMNGRDLEDPATARFLTGRIPQADYLRRLTLLTFADISAVNPTAMSPWRLEQLWRVYIMAREQMTRELAVDRIEPTERAFGDGPGLETEREITAFLNGLPRRYLRLHSRADIEKHLALKRADRPGKAGLSIDRNADAYVLTLVTRDRPGLFAMICGALASFGMNILKGEAFSNAEGYVVDLVRFADPMQTLELNAAEVSRLESTVQRVLDGALRVEDLLQRRPALRKPSRGARVLPAVKFSNEASDAATLIEFTGEDRPGLLYELASTLSKAECNIDLVMIDTEALRAIDVFYVTRENAKLTPAFQNRLQSELLAVAAPA